MIKSLYLDSVGQMLDYATRYLVTFSENILGNDYIRYLETNNNLAMTVFIILDFKS